MHILTVTSPIRLDMFMLSKGCVLSRSKAQDFIKEGRASVNGSIVTKSSYMLEAGDEVIFEPEEIKEETNVKPEDLELRILHEDDECMVIDKPRGKAVHPGAGMKPGEKTILNGLAYLFLKRSIPFSESAVLVHRLDKETSGCLLVAKNPEAQLSLQKQFHDRKVTKKYLALVAGTPNPADAIIDADIGRDTGNRTKMSVLKAGKTRSAKTTYRTLANVEGASLLKIDLHTGRTHQIRVHLKTIGHPVLGDSKYGNRGSNSLSVENGIDFLCLHAWKLRFRSPAGKEASVTGEVPDDLKKIIRILGLSQP